MATGVRPPASAPSEIASLEKTDANWTTTAVVATDILIGGAPMSIVVNVVARPVYVFFGASDIQHSVAAAVVLLQLVEGATVLQFMRGAHPTASGRTALGGSHARISTPGAHTLKLQTVTATAGTTTIPATVNNPIFLRAVEF